MYVVVRSMALLTSSVIQELKYDIQLQNGKQKYNNVGTVPKSNRKIVEIVKITTHRTQIHDYSLSWLGTSIPIKGDGVIFMGPDVPFM